MPIPHTWVMSLACWTAYVAVCRAGSLSAAAHQLGYTQSAVSRQIATLERDLGVTLLARERRGVRPTAAGEAVLPHARLVVAEAERARHAARSARPGRHLSVGAVPSAAVSLVPAALRLPAEPAGWTMRTELTPRLVEEVAGGALDLAVVTDSPPGLPRVPGVVLRHLFDDPMGVVLPADHPLAGRATVDVADLAGECWIEDNPGSEALLHQLAARHGLVLRIDRSSFDLMTKIALVAAGHGVALVPATLAPALRPDVTLAALPDPPRRGVYVATRRGRDDLDEFAAALAGLAPPTAGGPPGGGPAGVGPAGTGPATGGAAGAEPATGGSATGASATGGAGGGGG